MRIIDTDTLEIKRAFPVLQHASPGFVQGPHEILVVLLQMKLVHSVCYFRITEPLWIGSGTREWKSGPKHPALLSAAKICTFRPLPDQIMDDHSTKLPMSH